MLLFFSRVFCARGYLRIGQWSQAMILINQRKFLRGHAMVPFKNDGGETSVVRQEEKDVNEFF